MSKKKEKETTISCDMMEAHHKIMLAYVKIGNPSCASADYLRKAMGNLGNAITTLPIEKKK